MQPSAKVVHKVNLDVLKTSRKKLPMLIFKTDKSNNGRRSLYNVTDRTTFDVKLPFSYKYKFAGSSHGWLFCTRKTMAITLVNPINNGCISLPVFNDPNDGWRKSCFDYYIKKGLLISDPDASLNSFGVVVMYGGLTKLAFFNSAEWSWNFINSEGFFCNDFIHYKGKLYGVDSHGKLVEVDIPNRTIKTIVLGTKYSANVAYLVESQDGELLMVKRMWLGDIEDDDVHGEDNPVEAEYSGNEHYDNDNVDYHNVDYQSDDYYDSDAEAIDHPALKNLDDDSFPRSFEFKVFKMTHPIEEGSATWVEMKSIGEQVLFVGDNQSVSVSAVDFPGCLPNSIYYITHHHKFIPRYLYRGLNEDSGVFNLENEGFYLYHDLDSSEKYEQPPIWFVPNPQEMNFKCHL